MVASIHLALLALSLRQAATELMCNKLFCGLYKCAMMIFLARIDIPGSYLL